MCTITIFTTYLEYDSILFGEGEKRKDRRPYVVENLAQIQDEIFSLNTQMREVWDTLMDEDKEEAIITAKPEWKDRVQWWKKRASAPEHKSTLETIWNAQKFFIIEHSVGKWSIYQSLQSEGVYALQKLDKRKTLVEWSTDLIRIAKVLCSQATTINLILHEKDIVRERDEPLYVYDEEELKEIFGGEEKFCTFKKKNGINQLNVILFQHGNSKVANRLLNNKQLGDVNTEVNNIVNEARSSKAKAKDEGLDSSKIQTNFDLKFQRTIKKLEESDPIGESYNIHKK